MSDKVALLCSPVATGHLTPLLGVAGALKANGYHVTLAIAGDPDEPASKHAKAVAATGATFLDLDGVLAWSRPELPNGPIPRSFIRAVECGETFAKHIIETFDALPSLIVYDMFALWSCIVHQRVSQHLNKKIKLVSIVSGLPMSYNAMMPPTNPYVLEAIPRFGIAYEPNPDMIFAAMDTPILAFCSPKVALSVPADWHLVGFQRPTVDPTPLDRYALARREGKKIVYLALGTAIHKYFKNSHGQFLKELYNKVTLAALKLDALVVASIMHYTKEELGIDDSSLAEIADLNAPVLLSDGSEIPRVTTMSYIPQSSFFQNVGVDLFLSHGGCNSFQEAIYSACPLAIIPWYGDQFAVANTARALGIGEFIKSPMPNADSELTVDEFCQEKMVKYLTTDCYSSVSKQLRDHVVAEAQDTDKRMLEVFLA